MDLVELTKQLVMALVSDSEAVSVKKFETDEDNTILIQVMVAADDMGKVIGKGGKIANAIRTLVQASGYINHQRVRINIDSF
ncbi:MAG: KH domain-containing protein [Bacilli bacterium]